jgi:hypothetical protein
VAEFSQCKTVDAAQLPVLNKVGFLVVVVATKLASGYFVDQPRGKHVPVVTCERKEKDVTHPRFPIALHVFERGKFSCYGALAVGPILLWP